MKISKLLFDENFWFMPGDETELEREIVLTDPSKKEKITLPKGMKVRIDLCRIGKTNDMMTYFISVPVVEREKAFPHTTLAERDTIHELIQETEFNDCDFVPPKGRPLYNITNLNGLIELSLGN